MCWSNPIELIRHRGREGWYGQASSPGSANEWEGVPQDLLWKELEDKEINTINSAADPAETWIGLLPYRRESHPNLSIKTGAGRLS
jgi:hypothetical protein|nr:hypothetical protein Q903MT_gene6193 [Picea sitchensis]